MRRLRCLTQSEYDRMLQSLVYSSQYRLRCDRTLADTNAQYSAAQLDFVQFLLYHQKQSDGNITLCCSLRDFHKFWHRENGIMFLLFYSSVGLDSCPEAVSTNMSGCEEGIRVLNIWYFFSFHLLLNKIKCECDSVKHYRTVSMLSSNYLTI